KIVGSLASRSLDLDRADRRLQRPDDSFRDLVLQVEDISHPTVIAIGPDMGPILPVDQLRRYANPVFGPAQAAFEDVAYAEFTTYLLQVFCPALVGEGSVACDDNQRADAR